MHTQRFYTLTASCPDRAGIVARVTAEGVCYPVARTATGTTPASPQRRKKAARGRQYRRGGDDMHHEEIEVSGGFVACMAVMLLGVGYILGTL